MAGWPPVFFIACMLVEKKEVAMKLRNHKSQVELADHTHLLKVLNTSKGGVTRLIQNGIQEVR